MNIRPSVKAGSWYANSPTALREQLDVFLRNVGDDHGEKIIAGVAPHAGLAFSGLLALQVYRAMQQTNSPIETIIIFGAVHTERLSIPAMWADGAWATPLGDLLVDEDLAQKILAVKIAENKYSPHYQDNAIELQTPIIKYLLPSVKILPIALPPNNEAVKFGENVAAIVKNEQKNIVVVASTDLTHYGAQYGFAPVGMGEKAHRWAKNNDRELLTLVENLAAEKIVPMVEQQHNACGAGALAAVTAYARAMKSPRGELLTHLTSAEIMPEQKPELFVGYASMIFRHG